MRVLVLDTEVVLVGQSYAVVAKTDLDGLNLSSRPTDTMPVVD